jgi:hypothetical protein
MDAAILKPDYHGGSIANVVSSLIGGLGGDAPYNVLPQLPVEEISQARNVVLMVLDGLGYNYLMTRDPGSALRRHLRTRITSVFPTTTASAITTFLTGLTPQQHGLTGWFMFLKEIGVVTAILPFQPRYGGASLSAAKISTSDLFQLRSTFERIARRSYVISPQRIVNSEFSLATTRTARRRAYQNLDEYFALIERTVREPESKYIYAYWPEFDSLCHTHGIGSAQAAAHFAKLDSGFAKLTESLAGSDTLLLVCADHGLIDTTPARTIVLDSHPRFAETLALPLCGEPRLAYCYVRPARVTQFQNYVTQELSEYCWMIPAEQAIEENMFGTGTPHPRLYDRIGDYLLLMKENYVIQDLLRGEKAFSQIGVHGGLTADELYVPLVVARV